MKKILLIGLLFIGFNCLGQKTGTWQGDLDNDDLPSTNQKEYNYLTSGLKIQRESGLDIIDGYELLEGGKVSLGDQYIFNFSNLIEKSTGNLKGISVVVLSGISKNTYYLCIPINNKGLFLEYQKKTNAFVIELSHAYNTAMTMQYSGLAQRYSERNKVKE
jgi:hypothetical protein